MAEELEVVVEESVVESTEGETLEAESTEVETGEAEELELVLEGEQPQAETNTDHVVRRLQKKRDRLNTQNTDLEDRNVALEARVKELETTPAPITDTPPDQNDFDTDAGWQQANAAYYRKIAGDEIDRRQGKIKATNDITQQKAQVKDLLDSHYSSADTLIKDHNIKGYDDAEKAVVDVLGEDAVKHAIILAEGDSAKLMLYWGRNPGKLKAFKDEMDAGKIRNLSGRIGRICENLKFKPKQLTNAPDPASTVEGNTSPTMTQTERKWRDKFDAAARSNDRSAYVTLRKEGEARGVSTLFKGA